MDYKGNAKSTVPMAVHDVGQGQGGRATTYALLILTFVLWGSLYVVSKYVLGKLPTFTFSFLRFTIAFITLSLIGRRRKVSIARRDVPWLLVLGVFGYFMAVGAQLLGTKYTSASMSSLLNSLNPVTMTLFGAIILHEKLTFRKVAGIVLALMGVYAILGGGAAGSKQGIAYSLFSVLLWSLVSVLVRRIDQVYDPIQITRYGVGIAAVCYLPISAYEVTTSGISLDLPCILALLYMSVACTGIAYFFWNRCLSVLEAGVCSAFYPMQPLVSALLGMVFLKETMGIAFWMGSVLIVAGILVNLSGERHRSN